MKVKFFGEMTKARLDVDPVAGQEVERIINDAVELDAALLGKLRHLLKVKRYGLNPCSLSGLSGLAHVRLLLYLAENFNRDG